MLVCSFAHACNGRGKEEKARERAQMKIGEVMLSTMALGQRVVFGHIIKNVSDAFRASDTVTT